jgi:hypothetical protein
VGICPEHDERGSGRIYPVLARGGSEERAMNMEISPECIKGRKEGRDSG